MHSAPTVNRNSPDAVGAPLRRPARLSRRPGGRSPFVILQFVGSIPVLVAPQNQRDSNCAAYSTPTMPTGKSSVVIEQVQQPTPTKAAATAATPLIKTRLHLLMTFSSSFSFLHGPRAHSRHLSEGTAGQGGWGRGSRTVSECHRVRRRTFHSVHNGLWKLETITRRAIVKSCGSHSVIRRPVPSLQLFSPLAPDELHRRM